MKKTIIYFLAVVGIMMSSCQLDELPSGQIVAESAITDSNTAENALNGAYSRFASAGINYNDIKNIEWSDNNELLPAQIAGVIHSWQGPGFGLNINVVTATDYEPEDVWENRYQTILAANGVITGVEALPADAFAGNRKAEVIAEAQFLRAYANFSLLSYFGQFYDVNSENGIILRNSLTIATDIVKARSTVAECYEAVLSDLDAAIANAPNSNEKYYATSWVAKLLKARVLLYRGNGTDYTDAKNLALDVIDNGSYQLDGMQSLFSTNGLNSSEVILGLVPGANQTDHQNSYIAWLDRGWDPNYIASQEFIDLLENDPRKNWMLGTGPEGGTTLTKYAGEVTEVSYAFRLTEAYLIVSETYAREGNESMAKTYLKEVLEKADVTDFSMVDAATGDDLLFEIYKEYTINMCTEDGHEWFALQRCLPFTKVQELRPGIASKDQYIMPIPQTELIRNSRMTQNSGYQDF